jgi:ATP-dependent Clp protease ATP-binding subunit ClpB
VRGSFKPEFVNRLDDVLVFEQLGLAELTRIVEVQLEQLAKRLADRRLSLSVSDDAKRWLAERGFDPVYGARPLRRLVQTAVGDQLAKELLAGEIRDGDEVLVTVAGGGEALMVGAGARAV